MGTKSVIALLLWLPLGLVGYGAELVGFESTGTFSQGIYWLADAKLQQMALWEFADVPQGLITLELNAFTHTDCKKKRDNRVFLRLFYRGSDGGRWEATDMSLKYMGGEGDLQRLWGKVSFVWTGGNRLTVMVVRTYACDPHIGVTEESLGFPAEKPAPPTPPPPEPQPSPPPPPPTPCYDIPGAICYPDGESLEAIYGIEIPEVPVEERIVLPETSSPAEAYVLEEGHYWGVLGGELSPWGATDTQDWYKIVVPPGKAAVVYVEQLGVWEYQIFIYDICGYYREEAALQANYCLLPHTEEDDTYLIRVFRESGVGEYLISVLFVDLCQ